MLGRAPRAASRTATLDQHRASTAEACEPLHGLRLPRRRDRSREIAHHDWLVLTDPTPPEPEVNADEPPEEVLDDRPEDAFDDELADLLDDDAALAVDENFVSVTITPPTATNSETASAATHLRISRTRLRRA
jgi:hypothetical protein